MKSISKHLTFVFAIVLAMFSAGQLQVATAASIGKIEIDLPNAPVSGGTQVGIPVALTDFNDDSLNVRLSAITGTFTLAHSDNAIIPNRGFSSLVNQENLSFHGTTTDVVNALATDLLWTAPGDSSTETSLTLLMEVSKFVSGTTYDSWTGHTYVESSTEASWHDALLAAPAMTYEGKTGYLATITSEHENTTIENIEGPNEIVWLGGTDNETFVNEALSAAGKTPITYDSQTAGEYYWASGPEQGTNFSTGINTPQAVAGSYLNWVPSEPNNLTNGDNPQGEACQLIIISPDPGQWNDSNCERGRIYLVEFDTSKDIFGTTVATFDNFKGDSTDTDLSVSDSFKDGLANTGFDAWMIAALALTLVASGIGFRLAARRK
jgi:hypothetical protein